jgi:hypothetical protein
LGGVPISPLGGSPGGVPPGPLSAKAVTENSIINTRKILRIFFIGIAPFVSSYHQLGCHPLLLTMEVYMPFIEDRLKNPLFF